MRHDDLDTVLRDAYGWIRQNGSLVSKGLAYYRWERALGPRRTTFVAGRGGVIPCDKTWLLAELRLTMLDQGLPVGFVALFDRKV